MYAALDSREQSMQRRWTAIGAGSAISVTACVSASSFIADLFGHQPALGARRFQPAMIGPSLAPA